MKMKNLDLETLLRLRTDDEFFFEYVINLSVLLIKDDKSFNPEILTDVKQTIDYVMEFLHKACVLSSYLLNEVDSLEEEELLEYSRTNFERVREFAVAKDPNYGYLIETFHRTITKYLD